ncbi:unnamed protein product, partial [Gongylonema pulchrum]|uniref:Reverse transcriptase domain-containing protein n=1 Tax=Gongylonema pulchrum TaxID=637853 RepID=A0A183DSP3_9BILA
NREEPVKSNIIQTYRFTRVPFGLTSSPFLLVATLRKQLKQENTETVKEILNNLYVDNVMLRAKSVKEAAQKYSETKVLFQSAKMIIREFVNNCQEDYKKSELLLLQQAQTKSISEEEKWKWELGRDENQIWRCNGRNRSGVSTTVQNSCYEKENLTLHSIKFRSTWIDHFSVDTTKMLSPEFMEKESPVG